MNYFRKLLISIALLSLASAGIARDGTLPLRLGNDGTLPLRLIGESQLMPRGQRALKTELKITKATRDSLPDTSALTCKMTGEDVSKHEAKGIIRVKGVSFQIIGICYHHGNANMEVIGTRMTEEETVEKSVMVGLLENEQPVKLNGRLTVSGNHLSGRYKYKVKKPR